MTCTRHFARRVRERIGDSPDPDFLARGLIWAITNARDDLVQFVCRTDRKGLRIFRFKTPPTGRVFFALVDTESMTCITVMPPGFRVGRQGKDHLQLRSDDI
jgi:hypothetical protein